MVSEQEIPVAMVSAATDVIGGEDLTDTYYWSRERKEAIVREALAAGFDAAGVSPVAALEAQLVEAHAENERLRLDDQRGREETANRERATEQRLEQLRDAYREVYRLTDELEQARAECDAMRLVVDLARKLAAASNASTAPRTSLFQQFLAAVDTYNAGRPTGEDQRDV